MSLDGFVVVRGASHGEILCLLPLALSHGLILAIISYGLRCVAIGQKLMGRHDMASHSVSFNNNMRSYVVNITHHL